MRSPEAFSLEKPKTMFTPGEVFNIEEELLNLKKYHGQEGLEKLAIYKEKLNYKKLGLAEMETKLFSLINRNPEIQAEDLTREIGNDIIKFALTEEETNKFYKILLAYQEKHRLINEVTAECQGDGKALYKKFFDRDPIGDVKAIIRPMTIGFCPDNFDDYAYLTSESYLEHRAVDNEDKMIAKTLGGGRLNKSLVEGFDNILMVESPIYFNNASDINHVANHEEQHIYNRLKADIYNIEVDKLLQKINQVESQIGQDIPQDLLSFMIRNSEIEFRIKDELSAYFKDGSSPKYISKTLLGKDTIYDYAFQYNKTSDELLNYDEFDPHYLKMVEAAVIAFVDLLKSGYDQDKAQSFLFNEPLETWPRSVARLTKTQKMAEEKNRDRQKYISKIVNKKSAI